MLFHAITIILGVLGATFLALSAGFFMKQEYFRYLSIAYLLYVFVGVGLILGSYGDYVSSEFLYEISELMIIALDLIVALIILYAIYNQYRKVSKSLAITSILFVLFYGLGSLAVVVAGISIYLSLRLAQILKGGSRFWVSMILINIFLMGGIIVFYAIELFEFLLPEIAGFTLFVKSVFYLLIGFFALRTKKVYLEDLLPVLKELMSG